MHQFKARWDLMEVAKLYYLGLIASEMCMCTVVDVLGFALLEGELPSGAAVGDTQGCLQVPASSNP